jgi:hypothetical protein
MFQLSQEEFKFGAGPDELCHMPLTNTISPVSLILAVLQPSVEASLMSARVSSFLKFAVKLRVTLTKPTPEELVGFCLWKQEIQIRRPHINSALFN